ncbi:MAG: hypothetical protein ACI4TK_06155 [Agathobacter sp.]
MVYNRLECNMRKNAKFVVVLLALFLIIHLSGCNRLHEKEYYSDLSNFITEEAVVDNIIYDEERENIVLWLSEIDASYQTGDFMIKGANVSIVIENGIFDKIKIGDKIMYTSAPGYFGDGYFMPIIGLSIGEEEILSFEEGYENLMKSY